MEGILIKWFWTFVLWFGKIGRLKSIDRLDSLTTPLLLCTFFSNPNRHMWIRHYSTNGIVICYRQRWPKSAISSTRIFHYNSKIYVITNEVLDLVVDVKERNTSNKQSVRFNDMSVVSGRLNLNVATLLLVYDHWYTDWTI